MKLPWASTSLFLMKRAGLPVIMSVTIVQASLAPRNAARWDIQYLGFLAADERSSQLDCARA